MSLLELLVLLGLVAQALGILLGVLAGVAMAIYIGIDTFLTRRRYR